MRVIVHVMFEKFDKKLETRLLFPGRKIYFRQIRDGVELPVIGKDDNYDFNYQEARTLNPPRKVMRVSFTVFCHRFCEWIHVLLNTLEIFDLETLFRRPAKKTWISGWRAFFP